VVVGQQWQGDERLILFVKLNDNKTLDDNLAKLIKQKIKDKCSPRHIPAVMIQTSDIPYTLNGKKVEVAIKKMIHGELVKNKDALANPESLDFYMDLDDLK